MAEGLSPSAAVIAPDDLGALLDAIRARGYVVVGPTVRDGVIQPAELTSAEDLPAGWGDQQSPGSYRLVRRDDRRLFAWAVGPGSWKPWLFPPDERLWSADRDREDGEDGGDGRAGFTVRADDVATPRFAFFGVRPCELAAIGVQDRVFMRGPSADRRYRSRREGALIVAVDCGDPSGVCFCASMGTGPRAGPGYDLALTEVDDGGGHRFVVRVGSDAGVQLLADVAHRAATGADLDAATRTIASATARMGRELDTDELPDLLARTLESPRWDDVAQRCLACANCTLVCPTCFCSDWVETADLTGDHVEHHRRWASCFTLAFSTVHAGIVRSSTRARYRQWLTHKLGTWWEQFDTSGCVGCGRCITWCPVGIDLTEEVRALRALDDAGRAVVTTRAVAELLGEVRLFRDLPPDLLEIVAGCAHDASFESGATIGREAEPADSFFVVRAGRVALELFAPGRGALEIETIGPGEVLGWSWLFPPYRWHFDAVALEPVTAIAIDGACLRQKCDLDPRLGYALTLRFAGVLIERLQATRFRVIDVYGGEDRAS